MEHFTDKAHPPGALHMELVSLDPSRRSPLVAVVILNWNGWADTIECLESVYQSDYHNFCVIVVDNGSADESVDRIKAWVRSKQIGLLGDDDRSTLERASSEVARSGLGRTVTIVETARNLGFSGGINHGISAARRYSADYVLLLNNDVVVNPLCLSRLVSAAEKDPRLGVVGCKIYHYSQPEKVWFCGGKISYWRSIAYHYHDDAQGVRRVNFVTGCAMLIGRAVLDRVGPWDERYFLNVEDWAFCHRVAQAGWKLAVACDATLFHKVSASKAGGADAPLNMYYFHRNRLLFLREEVVGLNRWLSIVHSVLGIPLWLGWQILKGRYQIAAASLRGVHDFFGRRYGEAEHIFSS